MYKNIIYIQKRFLVFTYRPKLISLVVLHTKKAMASLLLVSAVFVYTYIEYIPYIWLGLWLTAQFIFSFYRLYNARQLQKYIDEKNTQKLKEHTFYYFIALMLSTLIWTSATILGYIYAPPVYQFISLIMIVGIVTASVLSILSLFRIYVLYFILMVLPQFGIMIFVNTHESFATALFLLIYMPLIIMLSKTMQDSNNMDIRTNEILEENAEKLHQLAITDPLTKVYNRRYFFETAQSILFSAKREKKAMSLLMLDIDFFKTINDTYGHQHGDAILILLSKNINYMIRESDLFARIGGEEFIMLLPHTPYEGAKVIAEKIRSSIEKEVFTHRKIDLKLTISIGVSTLNTKNYNIEKLYQDADANLYLAKENGRNKVY